MKPELFHLGSILSITTERLVANDGMDAIYKILNYMTGEQLFTHQLPRASRQCKPLLLAQYPDLAREDGSDLVIPEGATRDVCQAKCRQWLAQKVQLYGEYLEVKPLPPSENGPRDPIQEAAEIFGKDRVTVVQKPEEAPDVP
jgi:hypothetical protein